MSSNSDTIQEKPLPLWPFSLAEFLPQPLLGLTEIKIMNINDEPEIFDSTQIIANGSVPNMS